MAQNKVTDYLKVDPPLIINCTKPQMTQSWAVVSFLSPEERIKQRFAFEANRFLYNDVNKQIMDTTTNIVRDTNTEFQQLIEKKINSYKTSSDSIYQAAANILENVAKELMLDEDDSVNKVLRKYRIDQQEILDRFEVYKTLNNKELEADFNKEFTSETSVRGFKIRGAYEELADAQARAKEARDKFEPAVHSFAVPVGYWCPWDPNADSVQDQDYMLPELNDLMGKYQRNVEQRNDFFQKRQQMMMENANDSKDKQLREKLKQRLAEKQTNRIAQSIKDTKQQSNNKQQSNKQQSKKQPPNKQVNNKQETTDTRDINQLVAEIEGTSQPNKNKNKNKKKKKQNNSQTVNVTQNKSQQSVTFEVSK